MSQNHHASEFLFAEETEEFPAAMTILDGRLWSAWIQALWPNAIAQKVEEGIPSEGIVLEVLDGASQMILSELITSLYTGTLNTDVFKVTEQLRISDYLQVDSFAQGRSWSSIALSCSSQGLIIPCER